MQVKHQRLMRTWYATDVTADDPAYLGAFSAPFPAEEPTRRIVDVDWSTPGEVMVTWLTSV
jgi:hypothetical protein